MTTKPPKPGAPKPPVPVVPVAVAAPVIAERERYLVGSTPILRDGVRFDCASVIELTATQAQRLGLQPAPAGQAD